MTQEKCYAEHGDWTGTHVRVESCPSDGTHDLIGKIVQANYENMTHTMNSLYNFERTRRLALEVWIEDFQSALDAAHGGTYREYDAVLRRYDFPPTDGAEELRYARRHTGWTEPL